MQNWVRCLSGGAVPDRLWGHAAVSGRAAQLDPAQDQAGSPLGGHHLPAGTADGDLTKKKKTDAFVSRQCIGLF